MFNIHTVILTYILKYFGRTRSQSRTKDPAKNFQLHTFWMALHLSECAQCDFYCSFTGQTRYYQPFPDLKGCRRVVRRVQGLLCTNGRTVPMDVSPGDSQNYEKFSKITKRWTEKPTSHVESMLDQWQGWLACKGVHGDCPSPMYSFCFDRWDSPSVGDAPWGGSHIQY